MSDFMIVKTAKGVEFKVSSEDYERVSAHTWYVNSRGYVVRTGRDESGRRRQVPLHRSSSAISGSSRRQRKRLTHTTKRLSIYTESSQF